MSHNIVLRLAYDGSPFFGWQKTPLGPTVEESLQKCLERILQLPITLQAASRTDRGVHAEEQYVNFLIEKTLDLEGVKKRLNSLLPSTIRILSIHELPPFFHPTLHAKKKEYQYQVCGGSIQYPKERAFSWHVPYQLDLTKMRRAAPFFLGEQDFSSFCNMRKNLNYKDKIRSIESLEIIELQNNRLLFILCGESFLYKMVRNIVGTLVYVGRGRIEPEELNKIFDLRSRIHAGMTAPAHGLTLKRIYYPQEFNLEV